MSRPMGDNAKEKAERIKKEEKEKKPKKEKREKKAAGAGPVKREEGADAVAAERPSALAPKGGRGRSTKRVKFSETEPKEEVKEEEGDSQVEAQSPLAPKGNGANFTISPPPSHDAMDSLDAFEALDSN